ncbi:MAG: hypothetical protein JNL10_06110 [Verrucomicrobiales bacterium]|nr:hypothetical protein [Verrucomicrobiales bacterium]
MRIPWGWSPALALVLFAFPAYAEFRAGIAVRTITPDPLLPVSGGMGPTHPAAEKRGELTVRALVLENEGDRVAIVSTDLLGFPAVLGDRVRSRVTGIPGDHILIGATHTHSAPDAYAFPDGKGGTTADLKYLDTVVARAAETVTEALQQLSPASLRVASGEAKGRIAYNYYAPDLYDPRVNVLQAVGADGRPLATLVNYAIHPEVIGSDRGICSPDLIGPLCDRIAAAGGGTAIFMNSAQGGMITADNRRPDGEVNTWEECIRIGTLLADESLRVVKDAPLQTNPRIRVTTRVVKFPVEAAGMRAVLQGSPLGYSTDAEGRVSTRLALVELGTATFLTIPGEALPNMGFYLKRKIPGSPVFLLGLTNDAFGYILTAVDWNSFKRYDYITRTSLGEQTGEILIREALQLASDAGLSGK